MSRITRSLDVQPGDLVTEVDTPAGPFYRVVKVNRASIVVDADLSGTDPLPVRLPSGPNHHVRVAV